MGEPGREEEERSAGKRRSVGDGAKWMGAWTGAWTGAAARERHYLLGGLTTPLEAACRQLHAALVCGAIMRDNTRSRGCSLSPDRFLGGSSFLTFFPRFVTPGYNPSTKLGQSNFLDGLVGYANVQRMLDDIRGTV
jgi:hypothetical protein